MTQYSRPISDLTTGVWSPSTGTALWSVLDESTRSDTDYISSAANQLTACQVGLSPVNTPLVDTGHIVRYTYLRTITNKNYTLVVTLYCGATSIASWTHANPSTSFTLAQQTLSEAQAANITDYTDLRLTFSVTVAAGGGGSMRVSWAEIEVPDGITPPTELSINDSSASATSGAVSLVQGQSLSISDSSVSVDESNPSVSQISELSITDSSISTSSDSPEVGQSIQEQEPGSLGLTFIGSGSLYESAGSANIVCGLPSGIEDGNLCIALIAHGGSALPNTSPAGWTEIAHVSLGGSYYWSIWYTIASGLSGNQQWIWPSGGVAWGVISAYSGTGYDITDPIMAFSNADYQTANTTLRCGSVTTTAPTDLIYAGIAYNGSSLSFAAVDGYTEDYDAGGSSVLCFGVLGHKTWSSTGVTGDVDVTLSSSSSYKPGWLIALNPNAVSSTDISITDSTATTTSSGVEVTQSIAVTINESAVVISSDTPSISSSSDFTISDSSILITPGDLSISTGDSVLIDNSTMSVSSDSPDISSSTSILVSDSSISCSLDGPELGQIQDLSINDSGVSIISTDVTISIPGTTHYVSTDGSNTYAESINPGTPCSLATAIASYTPGEVIEIYAGSYSSTRWTFTRSGSLSDPVTIRAYGTDIVSMNLGFTVTGSHLVFENISVTTGSSSINSEKSFQVDNRGQYNTFRDISISNCTGSAIGCDLWGTPSYGTYEDISVNGIDFHGIFIGRGGDHSVIRGGIFGECRGPSVISIEGYQTYPDDILVENVMIKGVHGDGYYDGDGIRINATNVTIRNCVIAVIQGYNPDAGGYPHTDCIQFWTNFDGLIIENCVIGSWDKTGAYGDYSSRQLIMCGSGTGTDSYTVANCLLLGNVQTYPVLESGAGYQGHYYNNTFWCEGDAGSPTFNGNCILKNNIFKQATSPGFGGGTVQYNAFFTGCSVTGLDQTNLTGLTVSDLGFADPDILAPAYGMPPDADWHPTWPSSLIDAGVQIAGIETDIAGDARDASPDIGAYEFDQDSVQWITISDSITSIESSEISISQGNSLSIDDSVISVDGTDIEISVDADSLQVDDSDVLTTSDEPSIKQIHQLLINDSGINTSSEDVSISVTSLISVDSSSLSVIDESIELISVQSLVVDDSSISLSSSSPEFSDEATLSISDSIISIESSDKSISEVHEILISDSLIGVEVDTTSIDTTYSIAVDDSSVSINPTLVDISQQSSIAVDDSMVVVIPEAPLASSTELNSGFIQSHVVASGLIEGTISGVSYSAMSYESSIDSSSYSIVSISEEIDSFSSASSVDFGEIESNCIAVLIDSGDIPSGAFFTKEQDSSIESFSVTLQQITAQITGHSFATDSDAATVIGSYCFAESINADHINSTSWATIGDASQVESFSVAILVSSGSITSNTVALGSLSGDIDGISYAAISIDGSIESVGIGTSAPEDMIESKAYFIKLDFGSIECASYALSPLMSNTRYVVVTRFTPTVL